MPTYDRQHATMLIAIQLLEIGGQSRQGFVIIDRRGAARGFVIDENREGWSCVRTWRDRSSGHIEDVECAWGPSFGVTPETFQMQYAGRPG